MYNQFLATRPKARRQKDDSPATAGTGGRVPRVGVNKSDLEAQGAQQGWTVGPVTAEQVKDMSSAALRWHEEFNKQNLEKAFTSQAVDKYNKNVRVNQASKRMWDGQATEEESQQAFAAGDRFASNYAQFLRTHANAEAITKYMEEHNLDATKVQSYIEAFDELAPSGKLALSPKAAGIGPEERLEGEAVKRYSRLHLLTMPNKALKPEDKLSADDWFAQHPELHDTRTPPLMQKQLIKDANTAAFQKQTDDATASTRGGKTNVVDYGPQQRVPAEPERHSFKQKIRSMSATELAERCQLDPAFKKALDEMT